MGFRKKEKQSNLSLSKDRIDFIERQIAKAFQYADDVYKDKIVVSQWIKKAELRRRELAKKYYFDVSKKVPKDYMDEDSYDEVRRVFKFMYLIKIPIRGRAQRFEPDPWQCWVLLNVFGFKMAKGSDKRLFRQATLWVGRKNAKTSLASFLCLYGLVKGEIDAEVYFAATTKEQASQGFEYTKSMIGRNPSLDKIIDKARARQIKFIDKERGTCRMKPLPNEADRLDGLNPSLALIDEKHAFSDNDMFNIIKTGMVARHNPLIFVASTAGFDTSSPFFNEIYSGQRVLDGLHEDDTSFFAYYTLDDESEIEKPEMWCKSNPSMGTHLNVTDYINEYNRVKLIHSDKVSFITKNLNVYVDNADTWIPVEDYKKVEAEFDLEELYGGKCYMGYDLSKNVDLCAVSVIIEHPDTGKLYSFTDFFFPTARDGEGNRTSMYMVRKGSINLERWLDDGYITEEDSKVNSYDSIYDRIMFFNDKFDLRLLAYDAYGASQLSARLEETLDFNAELKPFRQNASYFNDPLKFMERLIYGQDIVFHKNPVMAWNFRNVVLYRDGNDNIKIVKNKSLDSVDGCVANAMALAMYMEDNYNAYENVMGGVMEGFKEIQQ